MSKLDHRKCGPTVRTKSYFRPVLWMFGWVLELVHFPPPLFLLIVLEIGLAAAVIQAAAGGAFATVQSAAMGGYGVVVVNTAVRVEAAVLGAGVD